MAYALVGLIFLLTSLTPDRAIAWSAVDGAMVHPPYTGAVPQNADVIFSTRFQRPEALAVIRQYKPTRIEWVYSANREYVRSLRELVPWFGGALSSTIPLPNGAKPARDFAGTFVSAPWMKGGRERWITTTDPMTVAELKRIAKGYLDAGASSLQIDDPLLQRATIQWGGDFSESTILGFRDYLINYQNIAELQDLGLGKLESFNYRDFLKGKYNFVTTGQYLAQLPSLPTTRLWAAYITNTVTSYYRDLRAYLYSLQGRRIPISMNLPLRGPDANSPEFLLLPYVDYAMVETPITDFDWLTFQAATYRSLGLGYVPSIVPTTTAQNRLAIATLYALGAQPLIPWDVYVGSPGRQGTRFFGTAADYADLYSFVQENSQYLNDYEPVATIGVVIPARKYLKDQTFQLVSQLTKKNISYALVPTGLELPNLDLDPSRLSVLKLLVTPNPRSDFTASELSAISSGVPPLVTPAGLTESVLEQLQNFTRSNSEQVRVIFRSRTDSTSPLVLHVIRPNLPTQPRHNTTACEKTRITLGNEIFQNPNSSFLVWHSPLGARQVIPTTTEDTCVAEIPDCAQWGFFTISRNP